MGDLQEAQSSADAGLALDPNFTIRRRRMDDGWILDTPVWLARRECFFEGMRLAGVPEG